MQREQLLPKDMIGMHSHWKKRLTQDQILLKDIQIILSLQLFLNYVASDSTFVLIYYGPLPSSPPHLELFAWIRIGSLSFTFLVPKNPTYI